MTFTGLVFKLNCCWALSILPAECRSVICYWIGYTNRNHCLGSFSSSVHTHTCMQIYEIMNELAGKLQLSASLKPDDVISINLLLTLHLLHLWPQFSAGPLPSPLSSTTAKPGVGQVLLPFPSCGLKATPSLEEKGGEKRGREWGRNRVAPVGARSGVNPQPKHCSII